MDLYRELTAAAQTAFAELTEQIQLAETRRSAAYLSGKIAYKTIKGRRYAYWSFKELDGSKREYYLGPSSAIIDALEAARSQPVPALAAIGRQASACLAQGIAATPPKHFRIAKRLADYQFFRAGGLLVGTHAFLAIGNALGVTWGSGTRTLDMDFAHAGQRGNVAMALPANLPVNVHNALFSLQMGFLPSLGGSKGLASVYVSEREPDLRVDFITPMRRSKELVEMEELGVAFSPLKFLDYLIEAPIQTVLVDRGDACMINLPDPARYGIHKLIVAAERGPRHVKYNKDIYQALALIEWHLARDDSMLLEAWKDLAARGPGWVKRARESLLNAPAAQRQLVGRFADLTKLKLP